MKLQLWSSNYDPEPSGIAPLSGVWARAMRDLGHEVSVVAAHPHYPEALWGSRLRPYREVREGIAIVRLPLWIGRHTGRARIRQELSFAAALGVSAPFLGRPDVVVAVTPSFPGLGPAMANARARGIPWVMWLQDILPDGAATTGLVEPGAVLDAARRFERAAYTDAARIIVISDAFERNLLAKGVPAGRMTRIYNPAAVSVGAHRASQPPKGRHRLLVMGNIGHSQGLSDFVEAVESTGVLARADAELRIAGAGVAEPDVRRAIRSDRVKLLGLLFGEDMEHELATTTLGIVTQRSDVTEFNLPSKLMNYMAHSLPVLVIVNPDSESARIVRDAAAGWVADSAHPESLAEILPAILADPDELRRRGVAAHAYATEHFDPKQVARRYERVLHEVTSSLRPPSG